ncbi:hypothetical protein QQG55_25615 [Brugia pahangi]
MKDKRCFSTSVLLKLKFKQLENLKKLDTQKTRYEAVAAAASTTPCKGFIISKLAASNDNDDTDMDTSTDPCFVTPVLVVHSCLAYAAVAC